MKTFIYTYSEGRKPRDQTGVPKTVSVWLIQRNKPILVGTGTETFVDKFQLVMQVLEHHSALPKAAFERHGTSNTRKYRSESMLKDAGFADVIEL